MRVIIERPDGSRYTVAPGENYPSAHRPIGLENDDGAAIDAEEQAAMDMLQEIERELGTEKGETGDWVAFFAKPIAVVLDKDDCLSCEFRRVCLNAGKKLRRIYGPIA